MGFAGCAQINAFGKDIIMITLYMNGS